MGNCVPPPAPPSIPPEHPLLGSRSHSRHPAFASPSAVFERADPLPLEWRAGKQRGVQGQGVLGKELWVVSPNGSHNLPQLGARGALGRRGREADPDSRSASERGGRAAGPESPVNKVGVIWRSTAK